MGKYEEKRTFEGCPSAICPYTKTSPGNLGPDGEGARVAGEAREDDTGADRLLGLGEPRTAEANPDAGCGVGLGLGFVRRPWRLGALLLSSSVAGEPRPQGSKTVMPVGRKCRACGRSQMRAVEASDAKLRRWRKAVTFAVTDANSRMRSLDEPLILSVQLYVARPPSHLKKSGGLRRGKPWGKVSAPDLSKYMRAVEDAITDSGVWRDDSLVVGYHECSKDFCTPGHEGAVIRIFEWKT